MSTLSADQLNLNSLGGENSVIKSVILYSSVLLFIILTMLQLSISTVGAKDERTKTRPSSITIRSTTDANGNQHPGSVAIGGPTRVTCTQANGNNPNTYRPSCYIVAPGHAGIVERGRSIGTSGAGTVTLTCNGQAPLSCTARVG